MSTDEGASVPAPDALPAHGALPFAGALEEAARTGRPRLAVLADLAGIAPDELPAALAAALRMPLLDAQALVRATPDFDALAFAEARRRACLPLRDGQGVLTVVLADPLDADLQVHLEARIEEPFGYALARAEDVQAALAAAEAAVHALVAIDPETAEVAQAGAGAMEELSIEGIEEAQSPVVRLVNATLYDALKAHASDVHLETDAGGLAIKYRLDGVLVEVQRVSGTTVAEHAISRLKVLSELDIAERRVPQDGRFRARALGREIDFRVSVMPSVHGEDAVLRILDRRALSDGLAGLTLERLGFEPGMVESVRDLAALPYGMLLVTGPTGSGKTTTLYAVLSETRHAQDKVITIEDPVEYQLQGVLQIPVNEKKGLTFARGLRSILRHDPDRIMVGEIRDHETAEISIQAALTGHLVYTTVHANNALDVIGRFLHMQVDPYNFVSAVNAVLAQRLVRLVCRACAQPYTPAPALLRRSCLPDGLAEHASFRRGAGCPTCRGTGYRGRRAIGELLVMSDALREAIVAREPMRALRERAASTGTRSLRLAALDLAARGETTLEEANRVTFALQ